MQSVVGEADTREEETPSGDVTGGGAASWVVTRGGAASGGVTGGGAASGGSPGGGAASGDALGGGGQTARPLPDGCILALTGFFFSFSLAPLPGCQPGAYTRSH